MFEYMMIASVGIALLSLVGVLFIGSRSGGLHTHRFMLPLAIGVFLGIVFFELIPETLEASHAWGPIAIMCGFLGFYALAHFLQTYHHHHGDEHDACAGSGARLLLIGDAVHNFADGIVIATAFMIDPAIGILTAVGVALHEIPQEIAEFGVLIQSGYSRRKALTYNLLSASTVILGTLMTYLFAASLSDSLFILTGIAAGNLLYIAAADLIPELHESHRGHFVQSFIATVIGAALIGILIDYTHAQLPSDHGHEEEHSESIHEEEAH